MPAFLARHYDEPVAVERGDDAPAAFVWRGRGYAVRTVLDHWWETGAWWQGTGSQGTGSQGTGSQGAGWQGAGPADHERECWRVEARAASRSPVVVELCLSWSTGAWTVSSVHD